MGEKRAKGNKVKKCNIEMSEKKAIESQIDLGEKRAIIEKIKKQDKNKQVQNEKDKEITKTKKRLIKSHDKKMNNFKNKISKFDIQDKKKINNDSPR